MAVLLSLAAAIAYGISDFVAGLLSRRLPAAAVAVWTQTGSLAALAAAVLAGWLAGIGSFTAAPRAAALAWGVLSGVGAAGGTLALYRGLGRGQMNVVAPVSALGAAVLPAVLGVLTGERLRLLPGLGVVVGVLAVGLVSTVPGATGPRLPSAVLDGLAAGAGFALLFVGLARAGTASGAWPLLTGQAVSLLILLGYRLAYGRTRALTPRPAVGHPLDGRRRLAGRDRLGAAGAGALAGAAVAAFLVATRHGPLVIIAVLTSLYPAATVVLAAVLLGERASRWQFGGLLLAVAAVAAISAG